MSRNIFFSSFKYRMFYVLYPFVTYLLTLPHKRTLSTKKISFHFLRELLNDALSVFRLYRVGKQDDV
jgi:hypothetical protein